MLLLDERVCSLSFLRISICILRCSPYLTWHRCSCLCLFTRHFSKVHNCPSSEYVQTSPEKGFDVTRSNNLFKLTDSSVCVQIMALSNTNTELPDIIGVVILIKTTSTDLSQTTQRIMSNIHINGSATVYLSVSQLHQKLDMLVGCGAKGHSCHQH
ncbi:hypothetical protein HID58_086221 [Brassica napus]|uniref:Uncharacterized protein n=1 Tax=Brassica napus TaxID=3708 RepID=A0ABQ7XPR6_BRANA|nr:hypothetical protein HID58_086221 [Brassica napus]